MQIRPFSALRPAPEYASAISSLPYDVMNREEALEMAAGNPDSFLHVVRSEIDCPPETDPHSDAVYEKAKENLERLVREKKLIREETPSFYLYRQIMGKHRQTAIVACCSIDDYSTGRILRHEKTRRDKEDDRTRHILTLRAQTGQIFLCYQDRETIARLVDEESAAAPLYDFTSNDGIRHTVWRAVRTREIAAAFQEVPHAYIADGHHRTAASFRAGMEMREKGAAEDAESNFMMACLFPASELSILPYHRCVRDLNGLTSRDFLLKANECGFSISSIPFPEVSLDHSCSVRLPEGWYRFTWPVTEQQAADPIARLDVTRLQEDLLAPILKIQDPRVDPRIYFVGGIRGTAALEQDVAKGNAAIAFAMRPTTIDQMMAIADAGETMPPKSTWFEPKLRSGLLIHTF
ncbi:MAG: DUF1015 domain-containing protein [Kiritimatiellia bacterium]